MDHTTLKAIREADTDRDTFNLLVEYVAEYVREQYEDALETYERRDEPIKDGLVTFDPTDPANVSEWLEGEGQTAVRTKLTSFGPRIWLSAIDGAYDYVDHPVVMGKRSFGARSAKERVLLEAEIAVRNEVAYRLTDRGVFPEGTWRTERKNVRTNED